MSKTTRWTGGMGVVTAGILLVSCVSSGSETPGTIASHDGDPATVATTAASTRDRATSNEVDGQVTTDAEAFCAGMLQMADELGTAGALGVDFEGCLDSGVAGEFGFTESGDESSLAEAFAVGCGLVLSEDMSSDFEEGGLSASDGLQMAINACYRSNFEGWLPRDYVITRDGVCFLAVDTPELPGCRTGAGLLVTTTTISYVDGDVSDFVAAVQRVAPASIPLSQDADLALTYGQELCVELRDFGGYDYSEWVVDVVNNGSGFPDLSEDDWGAAASLIGELPELVTAHLCPELAAEWEESLRFRREVHDVPDPSAFGGTVGEAIFYSNDPDLEDLWNDPDREPLHEIGRAMCRRLDDGRPRDEALARVRMETAEEPRLAHLSSESSEYLATAIINGALSGYCPRHSPYRWAELMSQPWPVVP